MAQISTPRTIKALSDWLNEFNDAEILQMSTIPAYVDGIETTLFMEGVVGHCGYTNFAVALVDYIMENVHKLAANSAARGPQKPPCYDALKTQADIDALRDYIGGLNGAEKSACVVYAVCEKVDNALYLQELCKNTPKLLLEDMQMLLAQIGAEEYDVENLNVTADSDTPVGQTIKTIMSN